VNWGVSPQCIFVPLFSFRCGVGLALGSLRSAFCNIIPLCIDNFGGKSAKPVASLTQIQNHLCQTERSRGSCTNVDIITWASTSLSLTLTSKSSPHLTQKNPHTPYKHADISNQPTNLKKEQYEYPL
jgi:hypothetical protein